MKIVKANVSIMRPAKTENAVNAIYKTIEEAGRTCYKSKDKEVAKIEEQIACVTDNPHLSESEKAECLTKLLDELEKAKIRSAKKFVRGLIKRGHEAMLEHANMTVRFVVDRGVSHEIVRHRVASFAQESTRYCNYSQDKFGNEITVVEPVFFKDIPENEKEMCRQLLTNWNASSDKTLTDFLNNSVTAQHRKYARWYESCTYAEQNYFSMLDLGATPEEARSVLPNSLKTEVVMTANMREWRHFFQLRAAGTTGKPHPQMAEVAISLLQECRRLMPELFDDILVNENE